jgi:predicted phosphodiesterase
MSLKIQYASDLHLEMSDNMKWFKENPIVPSADVLILAGDITKMDPNYYKDSIFDYFSENWELVIMIPGNHEYYLNSNYDAINYDVINEKVRDNILLLNNIVYNYKDINFMCTTLWSHIKETSMYTISRMLNDFHAITHYPDFNDRTPQLLTCDRYNLLHHNALLFLKDSLKNYKNQKNVVVSHHAPTQLVNATEFKCSSINSAFVVELYDIINESDIEYWIYGHTHRNIDAEINGTHIVSNQLGYVGYGETKEYKLNKTFKI